MTRRRTAAVVATVLYVASLCLPAAYAPSHMAVGAEVLVTGWLGFIEFQFGWYANLMLAVALVVLFSRSRVWFAWALVTALLSLSALTWREQMDDSKTEPITLGIGAYVWMAACCAPLVVWLLERFGTGGATEPRSDRTP